MSTHLLGSTVLMGLVFGAIFLALSRIGIAESTDGGEEGIEPYTGVTGTAESESPMRLGAVFLAIALLVGALSVGVVGGMGTSESLAPSLFGAIVGLFGLLLVGFLFAGSYVLARQHGLGQAHGVATGLFLVGGAGILLIAANLMFGIP
ncbi:hypothetical protein [Natronomonas marina]|jgi:hypothetical protein|uniref:hypothetical protein n=1 Tax=Natronomonas marina TaxID=2961939 RepID=UPI0020C9B800|nr:hypothetical protein [Natronomonas marina]